MSSFYSTRHLFLNITLYSDFSGSLAAATTVSCSTTVNGIIFLLPHNFKTTLNAYDEDC